MLTADDILAELRAHRRDIAAIFAARDGDATAAKDHEAEAKRYDAAAASARMAAKQARVDNDNEDAARHDAAASEARMSASTARHKAKAWYTASAKELAASDGEAAKAHEAEAKRMQDDEDAATAAHAAAEAEAARHEEDAAKKGNDKSMVPMFAMLLRAMTNDGDNMNAMQDGENLALLKHMMHAMTYPAAAPAYGKRGKQDAAHDDTAEDTALFRRLLKQYKDDGELSASRSVTDLRLERKMRSMDAALSEMSKLLTDVVHSIRDLATDETQTRRDLATDASHGAGGGPVRRTMAATGTDQYRGKFDGQDDTQGQRTQAEINAALDEQTMDPVQRMAAKLALGWNGKIKD